MKERYKATFVDQHQRNSYLLSYRFQNVSFEVIQTQLHCFSCSEVYWGRMIFGIFLLLYTCFYFAFWLHVESQNFYSIMSATTKEKETSVENLSLY